MDWLWTHYDRAVVLAAALFLILCSVFIYLSAAGFSNRFDLMQNLPPPNNQIPAGKTPQIIEAMQKLQAPGQWTVSSRSGLFVPEKVFIGANGEPATLQDSLLHPPVPNDWLEEFALPITEADVLTQDPDGDGFTNLDEWQGQTNPTDRESRPPYTSKLKLRSFTQEQFPLIFASSIADTYAINNVEPNKPTQFLHLSEMVKGTKYRLKNFTEKYDIDKYGTTIDVSELTLEQVDRHDLVTLVKEKRAMSPESVANFIYIWGGTEERFAVKKDQEFSLKPETGITYKLLDVQPDKAIIVNTHRPNEKIVVAGDPVRGR